MTAGKPQHALCDPHRLWSLWDMIPKDLRRFLDLGREMHDLHASLWELGRFGNTAALESARAANSVDTPSYVGAEASLLLGASTLADKWRKFQGSGSGGGDGVGTGTGTGRTY